ncbi:DUF4177 domain-containing protein [bacterium]|nr:DUF4177 domain-containing protein [bacterium]
MNETAYTEYKVIELSIVTDETIQTTLNKMTAEGWIFDSIHFVVRESSRRPSMAFIFFVRPQTEATVPRKKRTRAAK